MPEPISHANDNPEFARVVEVRQLRDLDEYGFELTPTVDEARALARLLGAQAVRKLRFSGRLLPADGGWRLEGQLGATVVQACVVTLEPVTTRVDQPVRRTWLPAARAREAIELVLPSDREDEPEPLPERIDLGLVAIETLALALPAYPRRPGATLEAMSFAGEGIPPIDESELKPFAALASLRRKSDNGS